AALHALERRGALPGRVGPTGRRSVGHSPPDVHTPRPGRLARVRTPDRPADAQRDRARPRGAGPHLRLWADAVRRTWRRPARRARPRSRRRADRAIRPVRRLAQRSYARVPSCARSIHWWVSRHPTTSISTAAETGSIGATLAARSRARSETSV